MKTTSYLFGNKQMFPGGENEEVSSEVETKEESGESEEEDEEDEDEGESEDGE